MSYSEHPAIYSRARVRGRLWALPAALAFWHICALLPLPAAGPPQRLTTDGRIKSDPVFTRGGNELVYTALETAVQQSLFRLKMVLGAAPERLHPEALTSEF